METSIVARSPSVRKQLAEGLAARELLGFLVWRDLKIRYKQTALGALWAVVQPLVAMGIFSVVFGRVAKLESDGIPYFLFAYSGLVPWLYFANAITQGSNSLVDNERIITKVYFPRVLLPASPMLSGLLDALISFTLLVILTLSNGTSIAWTVVIAPAFVLWASVVAFATSLLLSALNVQFRDVRYVLPFLVQVWMFASPVVYSQTTIPRHWRIPYAVNPMSTVIAGFRWSVFGAPAPGISLILTSGVVTVLALALGLVYFARSESLFADIV